MSAKILGFIGLGEMGKPIATNIVKAGFDTVVYDIRVEPVKELESKGARAAATLKELAQSSDIVIIMARDTAQVEEIVLGGDGVMDGAKIGCTIIIMSTINPTSCLKMAKIAAGKGIKMLDAPVSGARTGAESGTLTVMVGGPEEVFKECYGVFKAMGHNIFYLGGTGAGMVTKLVNNYLLAAGMASVTEAIALGTKGGIKQEVLLDVISQSTGNRRATESWQAVSRLRQTPELHPTLRIIMKDCQLVTELAHELDIQLPLVSTVAQVDLLQYPGDI